MERGLSSLSVTIMAAEENSRKIKKDLEKIKTSFIRFLFYCQRLLVLDVLPGLLNQFEVN